MYCSNCGKELEKYVKFCKYCGNNIEEIANNSIDETYGELKRFGNTYIPVTGNSKVKIISYFLLLIILLPIFLVSSIPMLQTILAIFIMKNDRTFNSIVSLQENIKKALIIMGVIGTIVGLVCYHIYGNPISGSSYDPREPGVYFGITLLGLIGVPVLTKLFTNIFDKLFFNPMFKHKDWILKHGIFYQPIKDIK